LDEVKLHSLVVGFKNMTKFVPPPFHVAVPLLIDQILSILMRGYSWKCAKRETIMSTKVLNGLSILIDVMMTIHIPLCKEPLKMEIARKDLS
jgi:hypothetical protein